MRFVIVTIGCDWPGCDVVAPEGDDAIAERTITMSTGNLGRPATPKTFAVCKPHRDHLDEILNPLLAKALKAEAVAKPSSNGSVSSPAAVDKSVVCRVPDCGRPFRGRNGLAQHVIRTHKYTSLSDYETEYVPASG